MADGHEELLAFRPRWWWDPVPDWVIRHLDRELLVEFAAIHAQLQVNVLQQHLDAAQKTLDVLQRAK